MRKALVCSLAVVTASSALALAPSALAADSPQQGDGKIALVVDVPDGGVALVEVRTPNGGKVLRTAAVDHDGTFELGMPAGTYSLLPRQVSAGGVRFVAGAQPQTVAVKAGASSTATVSYVRSKGVQCYGIGPAVDDEDGAKGFGPHSDQERILEVELHKFVKYHYEIVKNLAK